MKLFFRKHGEGQGVIILHGLFGQSDNWNSLAKRFGEHGFAAMPADLRNHGLSPHSDEWSYSIMAEDVVQMIIDNDLEQVHLIGHSLGGKVAMKVCLLHPGLVKKMIVCDIAPKAYPRHHDDVIKVLQEIPLGSMNSRKDVEQFMLSRIPDTGVAQFLLKNIYRNEEEQFAWRFNLKVIAEKYAIVAGEISGDPVPTPVLFLRGGNSPYIRDEDFNAAKKYFPNAELATIPNCGHWIHAEKPNEFFDHALRFFA